MNPTFFIIVLSLFGLYLSLSILKKKRTKDCGDFCSLEVIAGRYSTTMGVENAVLGSLYYVFMIAAQAGFWFLPQLQTPITLLCLKAAAVFAMVFSGYLVGVQMFIIKKYCLFCLATAVINLALAALIIL